MASVSSLLHGGMQYIMGVTAGAVYFSKLYPHTLGLPNYQKFIQFYNKGYEVMLDRNTEHLAQEVLESLDLKEDAEARVNFFVAFGQDVVSKGSIHSHQGGIIGLPASFKYQTEEDVEKRKVMLNNSAVNWDSDGGQKLAQAMVLSDKAKQFAVAREIFSIRSYRYQTEGAIAALCFYGSYTIGFALSKSLQLKDKTPRSFRGLVYVSIGMLGALTYVLASDSYNCYQDRKLDRKVTKFNPAMAQGGFEYYTKLLARNLSLRELLGASGSQKYTAYGNESQTWRTPRVPLTVHRDFMAEKLKQLQQEPDQESAKTV